MAFTILMGMVSETAKASATDRCSQYLTENVQVYRVARALEKVEKTLLKVDHESIANINDKKLRSLLFSYETLVRFNKEVYGKPFDKILKGLKVVKATVAEFKDSKDFLQMALQIDEASPNLIDQKALEKLEERYARARAQLVEVLMDERWLDEGDGSIPRVEKTLSKIEKVPWLEEKTIRALYLQRLRERIKELEKFDLDMSLMEEGIHELRKRIRAVLVDITAFNGGKNPKVANPIEIPEPIMLELSTLVSRLGSYKQTGQFLVALEGAYIESGSSPKEAKAKAQSVGILYYDLEAALREADDIYTELKEKQTFRKLREAIGF